VWPAAPRRAPSIDLFFLQVTRGAIPLLAAMDIKLATSRRPAQAVGYPAQGRGADGDGGGTAGTPPVGVGAIGVSNSHSCEIPLLPASQRSVSRTKGNPRSPPTAGSRPEPTSCAGAPPDGSGPTPNAGSRSPDVVLQDRSFRVATWNMCGQVLKKPQKTQKLPFAERLLTLENLDLLLLTETHVEDLVPSRATRVLGQAGMQAHAGLALITRSDSSWETQTHDVLVPGYAFIVKLLHRQSREQFWFLGVYGDTSGGYSSLRTFLALLRQELRVYVDRVGAEFWTGCMAAGDWNFVEHPEDRFPFSGSRSKAAPLLKIFGDIKSICKMEDCAGAKPSMRQWSYSKIMASGRTFSRIDRVYRPSAGWSCRKPVPVATDWSDHRMVVATLVVLRPQVERAMPAPRLPSLDLLSKSRAFWPDVVKLWGEAVDGPPMTLERWTTFKAGVLAAGLHASSTTKRNGRKDWLRAVKEENIHPADICGAMRRAADQLHAGPAVLAKRGPVWPEAVPGYGKPPKRVNKGFQSCPASPWQVPLRRPVADSTRASDANPASTSGERASAAQLKGVAALLSEREAKLRANTTRKAARIAKERTSEWFRLSSNKELDERGSRASVSVEGLRRPSEDAAHVGLAGMASVANDYFVDLHRPEEMTPLRLRSQEDLLRALRDEYSGRPDPTDYHSGPFSLEEMAALGHKMPNTAPGPDGIPYYFWKALVALLASLQEAKLPPRTFWPVFLELTNDLRARGTSRLGFKDANVSLFFKKGDPMLVSNYRPISSMNTDCKMYTNLVNARLAPWATSKLHEDQKGFVPGRQMKEHTRLASGVAHLCDASGTPGFIVSLDQAKAYDRVDQVWLLKVLAALGIPGDLLRLLGDIVAGCRSRVRINSGYGDSFPLRRGVRQGDPLSCLLFNFSIEPLAMRLRQVVTGISAYGLPPVKVMLYADDINLFLSAEDSVPAINDCLRSVSYTIGSKFNLEKTDVKPVGPHDFQLQCFTGQSMAGHIIPGAFVLPPGSPLRVLGVWVASRDFAAPRWSQVDSHIGRIIRQWRAIGASAQNRSVLAKALMLSRCHFLLDGNGIPAYWRNRIGGKIQRFVRGNMSSMAYRTLEAPIEEGGINCPSLTTRQEACDLRFLSELVSGPQKVPWKRWVWKDVKLASFTCVTGKESGLNPFLQRAHVKPSLLQDRVRQAFLTARRVGLDLSCAAPSQAARNKAPARLHPAIPAVASRNSRGLSALGIHTVGDVFVADVSSPRLVGYRPVLNLLKRKLLSTTWSPTRAVCLVAPDRSAVIWPAMTNTLGCVRIFTPNSLLTTTVQVRAAASALARMEIHDDKDAFLASYSGQLDARPYARAVTPRVRDGSGILLARDIHIWTDGSALDNGLESCSAGAAWTSDLTFHDEVSLSGIQLSNNVAEVAAVVLCLLAWRDAHVVIHTDSTFVLGLVGGGLLAMERDGWGDAPRHFSRGAPTALLRLLLYLLRDRSGRLSFKKAKAHGDDVNNNLADFLANEGRVHGRVLDLSSLETPAGWVDSSPVLSHQPLDYLTRLVVRHRVPAPSSTLKFTKFSDRWTVAMWNLFDEVLDPGRYIADVWRLNVPPKLQETLWKEMNGALVLGHRYHGRSDLGRHCKCGVEMSLDHILVSCVRYRLNSLQAVLLEQLRKVSPLLPARSLRPDEWGRSPWYPLLALRRLEQNKFRPSRTLRRPNEALSLSRPVREWLVGNYFWHLWRWRMKEIHDPSFLFVPDLFVGTLTAALASAPPVKERKETVLRAPTSLPSRGQPALPDLVAACGRGGVPGRRAALLQVLRAQSEPPAHGRRAAILQALTDGAYD